MGVHRQSDEPQFTWANAAVTLQVHGRFEYRREQWVDPKRLKKRKRVFSLSDSEGSRTSKRRRTEPRPPQSPQSSGYARHSNASRKKSKSTGSPSSASSNDATSKSSGEAGNEDQDEGLQSEQNYEAEEPEDEGSDSSESSEPPKPRLDSYLSACAANVFHATGNRRYILGIHASGLRIRFYMFDRAGVVYTLPLQLDQPRDARAFVSAILCLSLLSPIQLGLEPLFRVSSLSTPRLSPYVSLSSATNSLVQVQDEEFVVEDLIKSVYGCHGRGTTIIGVRLGAKPRTPTNQQPVDRRSRAKIPRKGLIRRLKFTAQRKRKSRKSTSDPSLSLHDHDSGLRASIPNGERLVMKLSWQIRSRQSEDALLLLAHEKGVEGVIRLYRSCVAGRLSDGPRGKLVPKGMYVDRELRVQILGPRCIPLKHVADLEDFKQAFRSLVTSKLISDLSHLATLISAFQHTTIFTTRLVSFIETSASIT